jgi:hypothetical protein
VLRVAELDAGLSRKTTAVSISAGVTSLCRRFRDPTDHHAGRSPVSPIGPGLHAASATCGAGGVMKPSVLAMVTVLDPGCLSRVAPRAIQ